MCRTNYVKNFKNNSKQQGLRNFQTQVNEFMRNGALCQETKAPFDLQLFYLMTGSGRCCSISETHAASYFRLRPSVTLVVSLFSRLFYHGDTESTEI